jgi:1-acyl-sn-glycerol-3-phosphate acyltransferase
VATPSRAPTRLTHAVFSVVFKPVELVARAVFDLEIVGRENVPSSGPVVLAANHLSLIDPPFVGLTIRRNVRYLALEELFGRSRIFDGLTLFFGAIPISRDRPTHGPMRTALEELEAGGVVGVFPEGGRVPAWGEVPPKQGAAWLALRTGAPLIPVALTGTEATLSLTDMRIRRTAVRAWVDEPLHPDDYLNRVDPLGAMMADWVAALDRHLAPWWAGEPRAETRESR